MEDLDFRNLNFGNEFSLEELLRVGADEIIECDGCTSSWNHQSDSNKARLKGFVLKILLAGANCSDVSHKQLMEAYLQNREESVKSKYIPAEYDKHHGMKCRIRSKPEDEWIHHLAHWPDPEHPDRKYVCDLHLVGFNEESKLFHVVGVFYSPEGIQLHTKEYRGPLCEVIPPGFTHWITDGSNPVTDYLPGVPVANSSWQSESVTLSSGEDMFAEPSIE